MAELFESIKRGLEEAITHNKGEKTEICLYTRSAASLEPSSGLSGSISRG